MNRLHILKRLKQNLDDLYTLGDMPASDSILIISFLPNPITMVYSRQHKLANSTSLTLAGIKNEQFILREAGSGPVNKIQHHLTSKNIHLNNTITIESNEAIKHAAKANMGISIVPRTKSPTPLQAILTTTTAL